MRLAAELHRQDSATKPPRLKLVTDPFGISTSVGSASESPRPPAMLPSPDGGGGGARTAAGGQLQPEASSTLDPVDQLVHAALNSPAHNAQMAGFF